MSDADSDAPGPAEAQAVAYEADEITLAVPPALLDKTVNVFVMSESGPSAFNLVVSRAKAEPEGPVESFAGHMVVELRKALPKFDFKSQKAVRVGPGSQGVDGIQMEYTWLNQGVTTHQRQTLVLVEGHEGVPQLLMITGTCPQPFDAKWSAAYDGVITGSRIKRPWPPREPGAEDESVAGAAGVPAAFTLTPDHVLIAHDSVEAMMAAAKAAPVKGTRYYDAAGRPLQLRTALGGVATFIEAPVDAGLGPLLDRFALIDRFEGSMTDRIAVHTMLTQARRSGNA